MFSFLRRKKQSDTPIEESTPQNSEEQVQQERELQASATEQATVKADADASQTRPVKNLDAEATAAKASESAATEAETDLATPAIEAIDTPLAEAVPVKKAGLFARLKSGLSKTRRSFTDSVANLLLGRKEIDEDLLDELEMILLTADVGVEATDRIIQNLTDQVSRKELNDAEALFAALKEQLQQIIDPISQPLEIENHLQQQNGPYVILMVGINGVGKTTTIGKLAKKLQNEGKSVMLAAGDTFRAAAVEQLQTWGERNQVPVIAQKTGADSAAVIFDAIQSAKAKNIDVLIADTAGRLHTQSNLMEELKKVKRVMAKVDDTAPHEVMLVIDAGTGQNALNQAKQFYDAVQVSGITVTKLDGTAKGGIVFALAEQLGIPVRFIGVGESIDDLRPFDAKEFTEALFDRNAS
ncbi:signal recognition particle-docking protein FtsY [Thiomicrorhabdus sp. zzn3]|uniref:signal recognition particle-docking protein FtsY n=1 Tax=Thiomicrorhabdus sp. zzn3 TaxID=3039775 RepID=UPI0024363B32|nr:signal recognition particle-docking protein FtsY [Thiomicrorhabdus sp. zzn3]MDG6777086.1 signal recognition particle-docking protein FtsY [Thiomicrorhabdus sp. zzn3]